MTTCPADLRRLYRDGRVVPFVGAGASMAVTWGSADDTKRGPNWSEMVDQAARLLGAQDSQLLRLRGTDLQILEYFSIMHGGLAPLTNWLSLEFSRATDADIVSCPIHRELANLDKCKLFYTTNYDNFIERALKTRNNANVAVVTAEHNLNHDRLAVEVVKFHGDFNSPNAMVVTESQYLDRMRFETTMDVKLRSDMLGRAILFLGYSFRDQNVSYLFHLVNMLFSNLPGSYSGRRAYILLAEPSEFERRLFQRRNIDVIPISATDTTESVARILAQMRD